MKQLSFIWDLDGTLLDTYTAIVNTLSALAEQVGAAEPREDIHRKVILDSVHGYLHALSEKTGISVNDLDKMGDAIDAEFDNRIPPIPHTKETLAFLQERNGQHFVVTHRGESAYSMLKEQGLFPYFKEIITAADGFPRKPAPDAVNFLIEKYDLDRAHTYYVGDRIIDMECAKNAGIKGILYLPKDSYCERNGSEAFAVEDLLEIADSMEKAAAL